MNQVIRATDVVGLPVVSIASGEDVAEVRDVVYDAEKHQLVGFTLNKRGLLAGRMKEVLGAGSIFALGTDAITITDDSALAQHDDGSEEAGSKSGPVSVIGNRVLTAEGTALGKVAGVILTVGSNPEAVGYEIASEEKGPNVFAPISAQLALSNDNLLLPGEDSEFIRSDLEAFATVISTRKASTQGTTK